MPGLNIRLINIRALYSAGTGQQVYHNAKCLFLNPSKIAIFLQNPTRLVFQQGHQEDQYRRIFD